MKEDDFHSTFAVAVLRPMLDLELIDSLLDVINKI